MKEHIVWFYGSSKIICGHNSLRPESIRKRNQLIGFDGVFDSLNYQNQEFVSRAEQCYNHRNNDGSKGVVGVLTSNISIMPFDYLNSERMILSFFEDVILANEQYLCADIIMFPLTQLKYATAKGYSLLKDDAIWKNQIRNIKKHCCYGHYYLYLLKVALANKGYYSPNLDLSTSCRENLSNELFIHQDGSQVAIVADVEGL